MKNISLFVLMLLMSHFLGAQVEVSGNQSGVWSLANSPYHVVGTVTVPAGLGLKIEPGVLVTFDGYYQLVVNGKLDAKGTEMDSVVFTTANQSVGWGGIRITSDDVSELDYCRIEYGKTGLDYPDNVGGGLALFNSNALVSNCVFADNRANGDDDGYGGAVYAINTGSGDTPTRFENCTFLRNYAYGEGGAIKFSNDVNTEIIGCTFAGNNVKYGGGAIAFYSSVDATVSRSLFIDNYTVYSNGGAVAALGFGNTLAFKHCTIVSNSANNGEGGGINLAYATADFVNTIIYNNPGKYGDDLFISQGGEAEVNYCDLKMPDDATGNNNINEDPIFVDENNGDYHLDGLSPCIDSGTDIGWAFAGTAPDIGCYEYGMISSVDVLAQKADWNVMPNPVVDVLTIKSSQLFDNVQVVNMVGQVILSQDLPRQNEIAIDLVLQSGIYTVQLSLHGIPLGAQVIVVE